MSTSLTAAIAPVALSTQGLVTYLQGLFGPLFLGIVEIVAIFFPFTREIADSCVSWCMAWLLRSFSIRQVSCRRLPPAFRRARSPLILSQEEGARH
jgi:hypothetical protein